MKPDYITPAFLDTFIASALAEDVGDGDHSSLAAIPAEVESRARLLVKEPGMLAGMALAPEIFRRVDPRLHVTMLLADGARVNTGDVAFTVSGPARAILTAERLVLNCAQRMSAIATKTAALGALLHGTHAQLPAAGKMGRADRRRPKPPHGPVRHDYVKGQSYRYGRWN